MSDEPDAPDDGLRPGYEPHLAVGDVTVTDRDVAMLRAIDDEGSMAAAADALGRSYPHLQRRVVELEEAVGTLTSRVRGGSDGGGTELTATARDLLRRFDRLRAELSGVTAVPESILSGTVAERRDQLATVRTAAGPVTARVPEGLSAVEIAVRADAVVLMLPDADARAHTSLRNRLDGTVTEVEGEGNVVRVSVAVADDVTVEAVITAESRRRLDLAPGTAVVAAFKSTAARAVGTEE